MTLAGNVSASRQEVQNIVSYQWLKISGIWESRKFGRLDTFRERPSSFSTHEALLMNIGHPLSKVEADIESPHSLQWNGVRLTRMV